MARDSRVVGRARIGAGVLAEVVNGFVDGISWKTLVCYTPFSPISGESLTFP